MQKAVVSAGPRAGRKPRASSRSSIPLKLEENDGASGSVLLTWPYEGHTSLVQHDLQGGMITAQSHLMAPLPQAPQQFNPTFAEAPRVQRLENRSSRAYAPYTPHATRRAGPPQGEQFFPPPGRTNSPPGLHWSLNAIPFGEPSEFIGMDQSSMGAFMRNGMVPVPPE